MRKRIGIIGSGVSGLSAAAVLAAEGHHVQVFEKNASPGGRLRQLEAGGFTFDMGPSWYWMPDVFERFYARFGKRASDFYELVQLDPGFQVICRDGEVLKVPAGWEELLALFESQEKGAAEKLKKFMTEAAYKYDVGINQLIYQPGLSMSELMTPAVMKGILRLQLFSSFSEHVRSYFKSEKLISLMEFPVLFLGALPENTPALYSLMNYAGLKQGTYYPMGGFGKVVEALLSIAEEHGAEIHTSEAVTAVSKAALPGKISLDTEHRKLQFDGVIAAADYHHVETRLLQNGSSNYKEAYWNDKVFAPSCLVFYVGVNKKLARLEHHNLFFDADFAQHARDLYRQVKWPGDPLFYVCCPSRTDSSVAPAGQENLFILMPVAPGLEDTAETREKFYNILMTRLEIFAGCSIREHVVYSKSYCINDFISDYNSYKGNAYGLANTLMQTANLKPKIRNRKIPNLYYAGQLTVPGPGVPPCLVSGQVAAAELLKKLNIPHETFV